MANVELANIDNTRGPCCNNQSCEMCKRDNEEGRVMTDEELATFYRGQVEKGYGVHPEDPASVDSSDPGPPKLVEPEGKHDVQRRHRVDQYERTYAENVALRATLGSQQTLDVPSSVRYSEGWPPAADVDKPVQLQNNDEDKTKGAGPVSKLASKGGCFAFGGEAKHQQEELNEKAKKVAAALLEISEQNPPTLRV